MANRRWEWRGVGRWRGVAGHAVNKQTKHRLFDESQAKWLRWLWIVNGECRSRVGEPAKSKWQHQQQRHWVWCGAMGCGGALFFLILSGCWQRGGNGGNGGRDCKRNGRNLAAGDDRGDQIRNVKLWFVGKYWVGRSVQRLTTGRQAGTGEIDVLNEMGIFSFALSNFTLMARRRENGSGALYI